HFPSFPILPGVLMIEAMVQAARAMLAAGDSANQRLVLGEGKALKFGNMVRPGEALQGEVTLQKRHDDGSVPCQGAGTGRRSPGEAAAIDDNVAVSGRFTMRPVRVQ